jgi:hypothetical protein
MIRNLHHGHLKNKMSTLCLMIMLLFYGNIRAQSFIPNYVFTPTIPGPYVPISTGPVLGSGTVDDDTYIGMNIGFPFVYDNITYTTFSLNANGYIRLGNTMDGSRSPIADQVANVLSPITEDLQGSNSGEIRYDTFGVAPNRKLVVQFKDWGFYNRIGDDSFDFQIVLHETTNIIDFIYGRFYKTNDDYVGVGITGDMGNQMISRTTDDDWNATTLGGPYDYCLLSDAGPIVPFNGLMYTFAPPTKKYDYSIAESGPSLGAAPGEVNQVVAGLKVSVDGIASYFPVTSITVNTTGSTSLTDVSNLKVYYTGSSPYFSPTTQFGSTVFSVAASNTITDSFNMASGDNYFWVTYDISSTAVLGHALDAEIPSLVAGNNTRIPTVTAPSGNRIIMSPMTYVSSFATQNNLSKVARGTADNQVIGVNVVTTSTGAPVAATQFSFDAFGTTDTADIRNIKVWYTGNNPTFSTGNQFGATLAYLPSSTFFTILGSQPLVNDSNYFWLTYDINDTAVLTNLVDGSLSGVTVAGIGQVPTISSPLGTREIRDDYCDPIVSNAANSCSYGYYISAVVTSGAEVDINNYSACNGNTNNYINYANKTLTVKQNQNINIELGDYSSWITYAVWIDYNQDGVFDNITERVFQGSTIQNEGYVSGNFTIPCDALTGTTRMRVRGGDYWWWAAPLSDPCGDVGYGETEDYNVVILPNPISIASLEPVQHTGTVAPGTNDKVVLEIPVTTDGCGLAINTNMKFSTTGTTAPGDITSAKLYRTAKATFNTSNLIGTVFSPTGQFTFSVSDTLQTAGTTFYWLTYDISSGATLTNIIDARFDSIETLGSYHKPSVGNPSGNIQITAPMTYVSSTTLQNRTDKVGRGTEDNEVISVRVVTSSTGAAINLTQFDFDAAGTTDTSNIKNMKVWYTGSTNKFDRSTQFGSTLSNLPGVTAFSITGSQSLLNDTNYFWLSYDIVDTSSLTNLVDASCNTLTIAGVPQIPTISSPIGSREIRDDYCEAIVSNATNSCNYGYYISAVSTSGADGNISNYSGCNGNSNNYIYYENQTLIAKQNQTINIDLGDFSSWVTYAVWIDYNQDGVFDNVTERVFQGSTIQNEGFVSGSFTIPCDALTGSTRMRIRGGDYWWFAAPISDPCGDIGYGEGEDYNVVIINNPISIVSLEPEQHTGVVAPGTNDLVVLDVPVLTEGCGVAINTNMTFSTTGTTSTSDILSAKLYRTKGKSFNNLNLLSTVFSPNGQFTFTISDTLTPAGASHYWLAYDISSSAVLTNSIDAKFDSVQISGSYYIPTTGNPSGNLQISAPMTYVSSTTTQGNMQSVPLGTTDNDVIGVRVVTSSTGAPINITQIDFSANGTTDTSEIENIKVWYTGNDKTFDTQTQFGSTLAMLPANLAFTITGLQPLLNDTNYFWLTYDVKSSALLGNHIDGECTGFTVSAAPQVPSITAPTGDRVIRDQSCIPSPYGFPNITNISLGSMDFYPPYNGGPSFYTKFLPSVATTSLSKSNTYTLSVTADDNAVINAWIDYNDDGIFDPTEMIPITLATGGGGIPASTTFSVPCTAVTGSLTMRVMTRYNGNTNTDPCRSGGSGEAHDYTVTILNNPLAYGISLAIQQVGNVSAGAIDKPILKVPVIANGCGNAVATQFTFATTGSTSATTDILSAKLYRTGASDEFNTANLISTVFSPNGQFTFLVSDTLLQNQATFYWLAYDISSGATLTNVVDAQFDSIEVLGSFHTPITTNPSGNVLITSPMTFVGATATQNVLQKVGRGEENNEVIGMMVITSSTGATINASQFDFNTNGTTDTSNIHNLKVWYTGSSNKFATSTQFGSTLAYLPGMTNFSITGLQSLLNDTNYFWLSYDVDIASNIGNFIDAEFTGLNVNGLPQLPTVTTPVGARQIREGYCAPIASDPNSCPWGYFISLVQTTGANTNLNNPSGCNGGVNNYIFYPSQTMVATIGQTIEMTVGDYTSYNTYSVWIDYNQDGVFTASERVLRTKSTGNYGNTMGSFSIPSNALPGITRMRVRAGDYYYFGQYINDACADVGVGETEDYNIEILPLPAPKTYVWNQTIPADFTDGSNWTPTRTTSYSNDKLVFNVGGNITVENVINQTVSSITVSNGTTVNMDAYNNGTVLVAADSLALTSGKIVGTNAIVIGVGIDTVTIGTITGTGSVDGVMKRWINSSTTSYNFPLSKGGNDNSVNLTYSSAPIGGTITARAILGEPGQTGLPLVDGAITINKVSPYGVWRLTSGNGYAGGVFTGTFTAGGVTYVSNQADLRITRRIASIAFWTLDGSGVSGTGTIATPILSRTGMSLMGEYGIGGDVTVNALPVSLTAFNASTVKENVLLTWTTASESNNKGFDVERSIDGKHFTKVGFVKGAGNSSKTINYNQVDQNAFKVANSNTLYYRLRQINVDGSSQESEIVKVTKTDKVLSSVSAYPNPFTNGFNIELVSTENATYTYTITDIQGKTILSTTVQVTEGMNRIPVGADVLSTGIYFLQIQGKESTTLKLIKTH